MRRRLYVILPCLFLCQLLFAQKWDTIPGKVNDYLDVIYSDTSSNYLYVAGPFNMLNGKHMQGISRWNGSQWDSLGTGIDGMHYSIGGSYPDNTWAMAIYHGKLYVGGNFSSLGKIACQCIGTWDGTNWDTIPIQPFNNSNTNLVGVLAVINDKLYVGGMFDTIAGFPCIGIACWNDTNWTSLNFPSLSNFYEINSICGYNGSIYVAGEFSGGTDSTSNILKWDGKNWSSVGGGVQGIDIWSMAVYNGELYVGGYFAQSSGNAGNFIQRWNGTAWHDVGGGTGGSFGEVQNLIPCNSKLYALGDFTIAGGIRDTSIGTWDGTEWCSLGYTYNAPLSVGCVYQDSLCVAGGGGQFIVKWAGGNYVDTCGVTGLDEIKVNIEELKVFPNPGSGIFNYEAPSNSSIRGETFAVEVFNMLGECIYNKALRPVTQSQCGQAQGDGQIDLSNQPAGLYLYRFLSLNGELISSGKLIIE